MQSILTEEELARRIAQGSHDVVVNPYPPGVLEGPPTRAAVLVPLAYRDNHWSLLFIRRTRNTNDGHSGQVAYPGGCLEPDDSGPVAAALREAEEEILGRLSDYRTVTNYQVTPVVGIVPWPYPLHLSREEVSRSFTIPLDWLTEPDNHVLHHRRLAPHLPPIPVIYFRDYDGEVLWGATASITMSLLRVLGQSPLNHP